MGERGEQAGWARRGGGAFRRDGGLGAWEVGTASAERRAGAPCVAYGVLRMPR